MQVSNLEPLAQQPIIYPTEPKAFSCFSLLFDILKGFATVLCLLNLFIQKTVIVYMHVYSILFLRIFFEAMPGDVQ